MRIGKAMTHSRRDVVGSAQPSTGTMADARQRDAGSTRPVRSAASVMTGGCGRWPRESRPRRGRGRRGDWRSRSERRRDICRSTGPGMEAGRCGRAAAKPREDRESVRDEARRGRSHDLGEDGVQELGIRRDRFVTDRGCRVPLRVSRSTVRRWRHRWGRWRMRVSVTPSRRAWREWQRARPGSRKRKGGRENRGHGRGAQRAPARATGEAGAVCSVSG